jgi:small subunit ribosomal protein S5
MAEPTTQPTTEEKPRATSVRPSSPRTGGAPRSGGAGDRRTGGARPAKTERNPRRTRKPRERTRPEFDQKIIKIRRVTRVVAGGRRFSFSVALVAGNRRGKVGVGLGKASDTALAIEKALRDAKRRMLDIKTTTEMSIPHETEAKYAASELILMPAPGKGLRAGSSVRTVLELAGVKNVSAKILSRSKNQYNNALATLEALNKLKV